jgi:hypothetical protein
MEGEGKGLNVSVGEDERLEDSATAASLHDAEDSNSIIKLQQQHQNQHQQLQPLTSSEGALNDLTGSEASLRMLSSLLDKLSFLKHSALPITLNDVNAVANEVQFTVARASNLQRPNWYWFLGSSS